MAPRASTSRTLKSSAPISLSRETITHWSNPSTGVYTLTAPDGQVTEFVNGQVAFIQDVNGNRITAGYTNGLLTSLTDSSGAWIDLSYNSADLIVQAANSEGQTTAYTYDSSNQHLLSVTSTSPQPIRRAIPQPTPTTTAAIRSWRMPSCR